MQALKGVQIEVVGRGSELRLSAKGQGKGRSLRFIPIPTPRWPDLTAVYSEEGEPRGERLERRAGGGEGGGHRRGGAAYAPTAPRLARWRACTPSLRTASPPAPLARRPRPAPAADKLLFSSNLFSAHAAPPGTAGGTRNAPRADWGWSEYGEDWKYYFDCMLAPAARQTAGEACGQAGRRLGSVSLSSTCCWDVLHGRCSLRTGRSVLSGRQAQAVHAPSLLALVQTLHSPPPAAALDKLNINASQARAGGTVSKMLAPLRRLADLVTELTMGAGGLGAGLAAAGQRAGGPWEQWVGVGVECSAQPPAHRSVWQQPHQQGGSIALPHLQKMRNVLLQTTASPSRWRWPPLPPCTAPSCASRSRSLWAGEAGR